LIQQIGSFGDVEQGWYFQSETPPDVPAMQTEHDELVAALKAAGVEVFHAEGVDGGRLKSCYTRDPLVMVKGGAIVCRMGARIRRGEELATTRTLAKIGVPILRTIRARASWRAEALPGSTAARRLSALASVSIVTA
jgi:N-dimethylarginine dimethylaminohydrolase